MYTYDNIITPPPSKVIYTVNESVYSLNNSYSGNDAGSIWGGNYSASGGNDDVPSIGSGGGKGRW